MSCEAVPMSAASHPATARWRRGGRPEDRRIRPRPICSDGAHGDDGRHTFHTGPARRDIARAPARLTKIHTHDNSPRERCPTAAEASTTPILNRELPTSHVGDQITRRLLFCRISAELPSCNYGPGNSAAIAVGG